jgi:hypothetical protein
MVAIPKIIPVTAPMPTHTGTLWSAIPMAAPTMIPRDPPNRIDLFIERLELTRQL